MPRPTGATAQDRYLSPRKASGAGIIAYEVAIHAKQLMEAGEDVFGRIAAKAEGRGDSKGLSMANEVEEWFKHGNELIEAGEKVFTKRAEAAIVLLGLSGMKDACNRLKAIDLFDTKRQVQGASDLDDLFTNCDTYPLDRDHAGDLARDVRGRA